MLPRNDDAVVERVLRRFAMTPDTMIRITAATGRAGLPVGEPISVFDLLTNYVELTQPATRGQVAALASPTRCTPERADLDRLADTDYDSLVLGKRMSVIDLLERYQSVPIEFATFLQMLPPMKARQYSISSSPLWNPDRATLTIAVVDEPARSGQDVSGAPPPGTSPTGNPATASRSPCAPPTRTSTRRPTRRPRSC